MLKTAFRAAARNVTVGGSPHVDPVPLVKGNHVFDALAAKSIKNSPFSGAVAEKDLASEARSAPVPGGPGASKTVCFQMFLKNDQHPGSARRKMSKSWIGPKVPKLPLARERNTFSKTVLFTTLRVASAAPKHHFWAFLLEPEAISHF